MCCLTLCILHQIELSRHIRAYDEKQQRAIQTEGSWTQRTSVYLNNIHEYITHCQLVKLVCRDPYAKPFTWERVAHRFPNGIVTMLPNDVKRGMHASRLWTACFVPDFGFSSLSFEIWDKCISQSFFGECKRVRELREATQPVYEKRVNERWEIYPVNVIDKCGVKGSCNSCSNTHECRQ